MSDLENKASDATADDESRLVVKAQVACEMAEGSVDQLSDAYEKERFEKWIASAEGIALSISDRFYRSAALHPLVVLLARAGNLEKADDLLRCVEDEVVRSKVEQNLAEIRAAT